jgi:hypothetical protein
MSRFVIRTTGATTTTSTPANENLRLQNLWDGLEVFAALFSGLEEHDELVTATAGDVLAIAKP